MYKYIIYIYIYTYCRMNSGIFYTLIVYRDEYYIVDFVIYCIHQINWSGDPHYTGSSVCSAKQKTEQSINNQSQPFSHPFSTPHINMLLLAQNLVD